MDGQRVFRTGDLALASCLQIRGENFTDVETEGTRTVFVFARTPVLEATLREYAQGELTLPARQLMDQWRSLKRLAVGRVVV